MVVLGIDYGSSKVGLALSNREGTLALPFKTLKGSPDVIADIIELIISESIEHIVVGIPRSLNNTDTEQTKVVHDFVAKLKDAISIPISTFPEQLSSRAAQVAMQHSGDDDASAAAIVLQDFLDQRLSQ